MDMCKVTVCTVHHVAIWASVRLKFVRYCTVEYGHMSDKNLYSVTFIQTYVTKKPLQNPPCKNGHGFEELLY